MRNPLRIGVPRQQWCGTQMPAQGGAGPCRSALIGLRGRPRAQISVHAQDALQVALRFLMLLHARPDLMRCTRSPPLSLHRRSKRALLLPTNGLWCRVVVVTGRRLMMLVVLAPSGHSGALRLARAPPVLLQCGVLSCIVDD